MPALGGGGLDEGGGGVSVATNPGRSSLTRDCQSAPGEDLVLNAPTPPSPASGSHQEARLSLRRQLEENAPQKPPLTQKPTFGHPFWRSGEGPSRGTLAPAAALFGDPPFLLQFPFFPRPTPPHLKCQEVAGHHSKADPVPIMHPPQNFTHAIPLREKDPQFAPNSGVLGRLPRGVLTPAWKSDSRGRARTIAGGGLALLTRAQRGWPAGLHGQAETRALRSREAGEDA